jgi:hypothetical protein
MASPDATALPCSGAHIFPLSCRCPAQVPTLIAHATGRTSRSIPSCGGDACNAKGGWSGVARSVAFNAAAQRNRVHDMVRACDEGYDAVVRSHAGPLVHVAERYMVEREPRHHAMSPISSLLPTTAGGGGDWVISRQSRRKWTSGGRAGQGSSPGHFSDGVSAHTCVATATSKVCWGWCWRWCDAMRFWGGFGAGAGTGAVVRSRQQGRRRLPTQRAPGECSMVVRRETGWTEANRKGLRGRVRKWGPRTTLLMLVIQ